MEEHTPTSPPADTRQTQRRPLTGRGAGRARRHQPRTGRHCASRLATQRRLPPPRRAGSDSAGPASGGGRDSAPATGDGRLEPDWRRWVTLACGDSQARGEGGHLHGRTRTGGSQLHGQIGANWTDGQGPTRQDGMVRRGQKESAGWISDRGVNGGYTGATSGQKTELFLYTTEKV